MLNLRKGRPALVPKALFQRHVAGLLTYVVTCRLPTRRASGSGLKASALAITAAGTVQDFHPIPY